MIKLLTIGITQLGSVALMRAIGLALLHSLWQGALVALLAAVLLLALHRRSARLRYQVTAIGLLLFVGLVGLTFGYYLVAPQPAATLALVAPHPSVFIKAVVTQPGLAVVSSQVVPAPIVALLAQASQYLDQHLPLLLWIWLLGMLGMSLRFMAGLSYVRRLRGYRVSEMPGYWQEKVSDLARQAGLHRPVRVLASALVASPLVVGHVKPLILMPLGAMAGLSAPEVEMILAHEIAHVVRKDYLVNLVQSLAEIIFFYHPAVWFLSASLRTERENCCDDIATQLCGNSLVLAKALSSLAEWAYAAQTPSWLAVAASGPRGSLLSRVQRLVYARAATPSLLENVGVAGAALGSAAIIVTSTLLSLGVVAKPFSARPLGRTVAGWMLTTESTPNTTVSHLRAEYRSGQSGGQAGSDPRVLFEKQLLRDKLITNQEEYTYTLTTRGFSVNGQMQSARVAEQYRALYTTATGKALGATETYQTAKKSQRTITATPMVAAPATTPQLAHTPAVTVVTPPVAPAPPSTALVAQALRQDGLLAPNAKAFELILDHDGLRINGQAQSVIITEKYRALLHAPVDPAGQTHTAVTIRVTD